MFELALPYEGYEIMYSMAKQRQQGISLLEVMISMLIGLILLIALVSLMITATNSSKQRATSELLDEQARQIFTRLENDLYRAGFVDSFTNEETLKQAFDGNNEGTAAGYMRQRSKITNPALVTLLGRNTGGRILPVRGSDNGTNMPTGVSCSPERQCLQVAYQALGASSGLSAVANSAQEANSLSGAAVGCNGLQATDAFPILINTYQVVKVGTGASAETNTSLSCSSNIRNFANADSGGRSGMQPSVLGVEQLVFRYLVTPEDATAANEDPNLDTTISGRSVTQYLDAAGVQNITNNPLQWASVVGVEVCVVVAAESLDGKREADIPSVQPKVPTCRRSTNDTNANAPWAPDIPRARGDMRLHRRYVRTILMPNSLHLIN